MDDCAPGPKPAHQQVKKEAGADTEVSESAGDRRGRLLPGAVGEGEPEEEVEVTGAWRFLDAGLAMIVL